MPFNIPAPGFSDPDTLVSSLVEVEFEIRNTSTVLKEGEQITLGNQHSWRTFPLLELDPTSPNFYNTEYTIKWSQESILLQHGGYYIDNDLSAPNDSYIREGGHRGGGIINLAG